MNLKHCNGCDTDKELSEFYFHKSGRQVGKPLGQCKKCYSSKSNDWYKVNTGDVKKRACVWRKANPEKVKKSGRESAYRKGVKPASENKSCSSYLGCVIAETVLAHEFPGFIRMPYGNPNYDYDCPKGFKIDVKSSCRGYLKNGSNRWSFNMRRNKVPHFFICIAWKDRESLIPEHLWLIPGYLINGKMGIGILDTVKSLAKWSKYERPLGNVLNCCDKMRERVKNESVQTDTN